MLRRWSGQSRAGVCGALSWPRFAHPPALACLPADCISLPGPLPAYASHVPARSDTRNLCFCIPVLSGPADCVCWAGHCGAPAVYRAAQVPQAVPILLCPAGSHARGEGWQQGSRELTHAAPAGCGQQACCGAGFKPCKDPALSCGWTAWEAVKSLICGGASPYAPATRRQLCKASRRAPWPSPLPTLPHPGARP